MEILRDMSYSAGHALTQRAAVKSTRRYRSSNPEEHLLGSCWGKRGRKGACGTLGCWHAGGGGGSVTRACASPTVLPGSIIVLFADGGIGTVASAPAAEGEMHTIEQMAPAGDGGSRGQ